MSTKIHGWINWDWDGEDIESFVNAFSDPYDGAKTRITRNENMIIYLKKVSCIKNRRFHPFISGIIYRKYENKPYVACEKTIIVKSIRLNMLTKKPQYYWEIDCTVQKKIWKSHKNQNIFQTMKKQACKKVSIIGGSLYGILLAVQIKKQLRNKVEIVIHEKGNQILQSWNEQDINGIKITNGFHGIEIPRALNFSKILGNKFIDKNFKKIANYKLIWLNDRLVPYRYDIRLLPDNIRNELEGLKNDSDVKDYLKYGNTGELGDLLKRVGRRYANGIEDYFHMIFPWYFPNKFFREDRLLSSQTRKKQESYYLIPKDGTFVKQEKIWKST